MATRNPIKTLTGLRGTAAIFVIITHYAVWVAPFRPSSVPAYMNSIFGLSEIGMTLFFTLSGFVITYNYLDFGWSTAPLRTAARFLFLRFSRLFPTLFVFLLVTTQVSKIKADTTADEWWIFLHYIGAQTWFPLILHGQPPAGSYFHVSWSISTEWLMYIVFAAVMIGYSQVKSSAGRWAIIAAIVLYVTFIFGAGLTGTLSQVAERIFPVLMEPLQPSDWHRWVVDFSPYFRLLDFVFGATAAIIVMRYPAILSGHRGLLRVIAGASLIALIFTQLESSWLGDWPFLFSGFSPVTQGICSLCCALIFTNGQDTSRLNHVLSSRPFVFIGEISYPLYLFHFLAPRIGVSPGDAMFTPSLLPLWFANFSQCLIYAITIATGVHYLWEMPAQKFLRELLRQRVRNNVPAADNVDRATALANGET